MTKYALTNGRTQIPTISSLSRLLEADDRLGDGATLHVGAGDVDGIACEVHWTAAAQTARQPQEIWTYLLENKTPAAAKRLREDPGLVPGVPALIVKLAEDGTRGKLAEDGTRGFPIGLDQLRQHRAMWLSEHDIYVTLADTPGAFTTHLKSLQGERVLDRAKREREATLDDFTARWRLAILGAPPPNPARNEFPLFSPPRFPFRRVCPRTRSLLLCVARGFSNC